MPTVPTSTNSSSESSSGSYQRISPVNRSPYRIVPSSAKVNVTGMSSPPATSCAPIAAPALPGAVSNAPTTASAPTAAASRPRLLLVDRSMRPIPSSPPRMPIRAHRLPSRSGAPAHVPGSETPVTRDQGLRLSTGVGRHRDPGTHESRPTVGAALVDDVRRRPTLPPRHRGSTIGAGGLNVRVRDGTGWIPSAMATETPFRDPALPPGTRERGGCESRGPRNSRASASRVKSSAY